MLKRKSFTDDMIPVNHKPSLKLKHLGFTIIELMIAISIIGVIMFVAVPAYQNYGKRVDAGKAVKDLAVLQLQIDDYALTTGSHPTSLADIGMAGLQDPWGNAYEYLNYATNPPGDRRKDKNLNPLNSDYDLYSKGEDGQTNLQIITPMSQDDIIRGRDGSFMGVAKDF